jgi:hypothetical protein
MVGRRETFRGAVRQRLVVANHQARVVQRPRTVATKPAAPSMVRLAKAVGAPAPGQT